MIRMKLNFKGLDGCILGVLLDLTLSSTDSYSQVVSIFTSQCRNLSINF